MVTHHIPRGDGVALQHFAGERDQTRNLRLRKRAVTPDMAGVHQLERNTGVPSATLFGHQREDASVFLNDIMRADLGFLVAESDYCSVTRDHAGIV